MIKIRSNGRGTLRQSKYARSASRGLCDKARIFEDVALPFRGRTSFGAHSTAGVEKEEEEGVGEVVEEDRIRGFIIS